MDKFNSVVEILDFAINSEQEAIDFYTELANNASNTHVKSIFIDFVKEEMGHKSKLLKIKEEGVFEIEYKEIQDLKISDYLVSVKASPTMSYDEALVVVMKKEKAAFKLYSHLAKVAPSAELQSVFNLLAREEANHKLHFEQEYDDFVLKNN